jgi:hypothetical protein
MTLESRIRILYRIGVCFFCFQAQIAFAKVDLILNEFQVDKGDQKRVLLVEEYSAGEQEVGLLKRLFQYFKQTDELTTARISHPIDGIKRLWKRRVSLMHAENSPWTPYGYNRAEGGSLYALPIGADQHIVLLHFEPTLIRQERYEMEIIYTSFSKLKDDRGIVVRRGQGLFEMNGSLARSLFKICQMGKFGNIPVAGVTRFATIREEGFGCQYDFEVPRSSACYFLIDRFVRVH